MSFDMSKPEDLWNVISAALMSTCRDGHSFVVVANYAKEYFKKKYGEDNWRVRFCTALIVRLEANEYPYSTLDELRVLVHVEYEPETGGKAWAEEIEEKYK